MVNTHMYISYLIYPNEDELVEFATTMVHIIHLKLVPLEGFFN